MWWNSVLRIFEARMSPAKMQAKYGGTGWVDVEGNAQTNGDWIFKPDISAVIGVPVKYWTGTAVVTEMTQAEKDAVDAAEQSARLQAAREEIKARFEETVASDKAIVLMLVDEINLLRSALDEVKTNLKPAALNNALTYDTSSQRTPAQARTAYRNKVDSLT